MIKSFVALFLGFAFIISGICPTKAEESVPVAVKDSNVLEDFKWPQLQLQSGGLQVLLALPEPSEPFYKGPRFDRSFFVYGAQVGGLRLFGPWKLNSKPGAPDAVTGMAGEFGMESPLGYEEAKPGEPFIKIGVGYLKRVDDSAYSFTKNYEVLDPGKWTFTKGETYFEATQELAPLRGWSYSYQRRIDLILPSTIKISFKLKNSGEKPIVTDYYSHNLCVFNDESIGKGDRMEILTDVAGSKLYEPAVLSPRVIQFEGPIQPGKGYYMEMPLPPDLKNPVLARIFNNKSGSSLTLSSDYSPFKLVFYAHDKALCAEPFIRIDLAPGQEMSWSDTYQINSDAKP